MSDVPIITYKYVSNLEDPINTPLKITDIIFNEGNMYYSENLNCSNSQTENIRTTTTTTTTRVMVDNNKPLSKGTENIYNKVINDFSKTPTYKMGGTASEIEYLFKKTILDKHDNDDNDDDDDDIDTMIKNIKEDITKKKNVIRNLITYTQIYLSESGEEYLRNTDDDNDDNDTNIINNVNKELSEFKNIPSLWEY